MMPVVKVDGKTLGKGQSCSVYSGTYQRDTTSASHDVAIKFFDNDEADYDEKMHSLREEFIMQRKFSEVSTACVKAICITEVNDTPCTVSELAKGKTLFDVLTTTNISVRRVKGLIAKIIRELRRLNTHGLVHSDTHLQNIIVYRSKFKLIDFNMSNQLGDRFYKKGRGDDIDTNLFISCLYFHRHQYKSPAVRKFVQDKFRCHVYAIRSAILKMKPDEWHRGCSLIQDCGDGKTKERKFAYIDWTQRVHFQDGNDNGVPITAVMPSASHQHAVYFAAHIQLPKYHLNNLL